MDFSRASRYDVALCVTAQPIGMQFGPVSPALVSSPGCTLQFAFVTTNIGGRGKQRLPTTDELIAPIDEERKQPWSDC